MRMASPICHLEIEHARQLGKRIIPVLHLDYERDEAIRDIAARLANPEQDATRQLWGGREPESVFNGNDSVLKHIQYFIFRPQDDFHTRFAELFDIIRTDPEHKEFHTRLELDAQEWNRRDRDTSFVLLGAELAEAQAWLRAAAGKQPAPTALQREYIAASKVRVRQLRNIRRASVIGSVVAAVSIIFALLASYAGVRATNRVNEANSTLTPIPATLTQAAAIRQEAEDEREIADIYGYALFNVDTFPGHSIARLDELIAKYPDRAAGFLSRALIYSRIGEHEAAVADYNRAIELDSQDARAYLNRGNAFRDLDDHEAALADYNRAIELDPEYTIAYNNRGNAYLRFQEHELAIADYEQALRLDPDYALALSQSRHCLS